MREPLHPSSDLDKLPVYDAEGVPIGTSFGVLTEAESGLVRYFDISLDGRQRHVLVPVGHVRMEMHLGRMRLRLRAASAPELDRIPAYEPHVVWSDDKYQDELLESFGRLFEGQRYYAHPAFDHAGLYAGHHPLLRDPLAPVTPNGLHRLSAARDFKVADGEPDIRGWNVLGPARSNTGVVTDLIIDTEAEEVRYVVIRRSIDESETLMPIGYVDVHDESVSTPLSSDELLALPDFSGDVLERSFEAHLRAGVDAQLSGPRRFERVDFRTAA